MRERIREAVLVASLVALPPATVGQEVPLQVQAAVQSQTVFVGQQFLLQIQIRGSDDPDPVDIGALEAGFSVTEAGGGSSNSTSVSIVNGQMTRQVQRGYNLNYRLAARRAGQVRIPSLTVTANGRSARTQPISLTVQPPQENDDFKFRLSLSESRAYVGQALKLTAEWYIGREVQDFSFTMPLLDDRRFEIRDSPTDAELRTQAGNDLLEFRLGDRNAVARKQRGTLDGREYIVVRFEKLLIPRAAGSMTLPAATVTFSSPRSGQSRRRSLFDDFFGGGVFSGAFGGRPVMETPGDPFQSAQPCGPGPALRRPSAGLQRLDRAVRDSRGGQTDCGDGRRTDHAEPQGRWSGDSCSLQAAASRQPGGPLTGLQGAS